eukprot:966658-Rhodomonas_salina.1
MKLKKVTARSTMSIWPRYVPFENTSGAASRRAWTSPLSLSSLASTGPASSSLCSSMAASSSAPACSAQCDARHPVLFSAFASAVATSSLATAACPLRAATIKAVAPLFCPPPPTHPHPHPHPHTHTHTHTHTSTSTSKHTHPPTHTQTHAYAHARAHPHSHPQKPARLVSYAKC